MKEEKKNSNEAQTQVWKPPTQFTKELREREKQAEIKDRRTFLGIPKKFVQDNADKHEHGGNPRDYKVMVPLACLSLSRDTTPRTHQVTAFLGETEASPSLYATLQAPSVVS